MIRDLLAKHGIVLRRTTNGKGKCLCPKCSHLRKKKTEPCLSVSIAPDSIKWFCHNCGWRGVDDGAPARKWAPPQKGTQRRRRAEWELMGSVR